MIRFFQKGMQKDLTLLFLFACGLWPIWMWVFGRLKNNTGEIYGLLALGMLALLMFRHAPKKERSLKSMPTKTFMHLCLLAILYAGSTFLAPPLIRAILGMTMFCSLISWTMHGRLCSPSIWMLGYLALPILPSLEFYLSYPLRLVTIEIVTVILKHLYFPGLVREGLGLVIGSHRIQVDDPCACIHMLWMSALCIAGLSAWMRLGPWATLKFSAFGSLMLFISNIYRCMALFFFEGSILFLNDWMHSAIGLLCFAAVILSLLIYLKVYLKPARTS